MSIEQKGSPSLEKISSDSQPKQKKVYPFYSKIPDSLWETMFSWHILRISERTMVKKLLEEHNVKVSIKSVRKLLFKLRTERENVVSSVIADKAAANITSDFSKLEFMEGGIMAIMLKAEKKEDHDLFLRAVDRQTKISMMKFQIISMQKDSPTGHNAKEVLLNSLLEKVSSPREE